MSSLTYKRIDYGDQFSLYFRGTEPNIMKRLVGEIVLEASDEPEELKTYLAGQVRFKIDKRIIDMDSHVGGVITDAVIKATQLNTTRCQYAYNDPNLHRFTTFFPGMPYESFNFYSTRTSHFFPTTFYQYNKVEHYPQFKVNSTKCLSVNCQGGLNGVSRYDHGITFMEGDWDPSKIVYDDKLKLAYTSSTISEIEYIDVFEPSDYYIVTKINEYTTLVLFGCESIGVKGRHYFKVKDLGVNREKDVNKGRFTITWRPNYGKQSKIIQQLMKQPFGYTSDECITINTILKNKTIKAFLKDQMKPTEMYILFKAYYLFKADVKRNLNECVGDFPGYLFDEDKLRELLLFIYKTLKGEEYVFHLNKDEVCEFVKQKADLTKAQVKETDLIRTSLMSEKELDIKKADDYKRSDDNKSKNNNKDNNKNREDTNKNKSNHTNRQNRARNVRNQLKSYTAKSEHPRTNDNYMYVSTKDDTADWMLSSSDDNEENDVEAQCCSIKTVSFITGQHYKTIRRLMPFDLNVLPGLEFQVMKWVLQAYFHIELVENTDKEKAKGTMICYVKAVKDYQGTGVGHVYAYRERDPHEDEDGVVMIARGINDRSKAYKYCNFIYSPQIRPVYEGYKLWFTIMMGLSVFCPQAYMAYYANNQDICLKEGLVPLVGLSDKVIKVKGKGKYYDEEEIDFWKWLKPDFHNFIAKLAYTGPVELQNLILQYSSEVFNPTNYEFDSMDITNIDDFKQMFKTEREKNKQKSVDMNKYVEPVVMKDLTPEEVNAVSISVSEQLSEVTNDKVRSHLKSFILLNKIRNRRLWLSSLLKSCQVDINNNAWVKMYLDEWNNLCKLYNTQTVNDVGPDYDRPNFVCWLDFALNGMREKRVELELVNNYPFIPAYRMVDKGVEEVFADCVELLVQEKDAKLYTYDQIVNCKGKLEYIAKLVDGDLEIDERAILLARAKTFDEVCKLAGVMSPQDESVLKDLMKQYEQPLEAVLTFTQMDVEDRLNYYIAISQKNYGFNSVGQFVQNMEKEIEECGLEFLIGRITSLELDECFKSYLIDLAKQIKEHYDQEMERLAREASDEGESEQPSEEQSDSEFADDTAEEARQNTTSVITEGSARMTVEGQRGILVKNPRDVTSVLSGTNYLSRMFRQDVLTIVKVAIQEYKDALEAYDDIAYYKSEYEGMTQDHLIEFEKILNDMIFTVQDTEIKSVNEFLCFFYFAVYGVYDSLRGDLKALVDAVKDQGLHYPHENYIYTGIDPYYVTPDMKAFRKKLQQSYKKDLVCYVMDTNDELVLINFREPLPRKAGDGTKVAKKFNDMFLIKHEKFDNVTVGATKRVFHKDNKKPDEEEDINYSLPENNSKLQFLPPIDKCNYPDLPKSVKDYYQWLNDAHINDGEFPENPDMPNRARVWEVHNYVGFDDQHRTPLQRIAMCSIYYCTKKSYSYYRALVDSYHTVAIPNYIKNIAVRCYLTETRTILNNYAGLPNEQPFNEYQEYDGVGHMIHFEYQIPDSLQGFCMADALCNAFGLHEPDLKDVIKMIERETGHKYPTLFNATGKVEDLVRLFEDLRVGIILRYDMLGGIVDHKIGPHPSLVFRITIMGQCTANGFFWDPQAPTGATGLNYLEFLQDVFLGTHIAHITCRLNRRFPIERYHYIDSYTKCFRYWLNNYPMEWATLYRYSVKDYNVKKFEGHTRSEMLEDVTVKERFSRPWLQTLSYYLPIKSYKISLGDTIDYPTEIYEREGKKRMSLGEPINNQIYLIMTLPELKEKLGEAISNNNTMLESALLNKMDGLTEITKESLIQLKTYAKRITRPMLDTFYNIFDDIAQGQGTQIMSVAGKYTTLRMRGATYEVAAADLPWKFKKPTREVVVTKVEPRIMDNTHLSIFRLFEFFRLPYEYLSVSCSVENVLPICMNRYFLDLGLKRDMHPNFGHFKWMCMEAGINGRLLCTREYLDKWCTKVKRYTNALKKAGNNDPQASFGFIKFYIEELKEYVSGFKLPKGRMVFRNTYEVIANVQKFVKVLEHNIYALPIIAKQHNAYKRGEMIHNLMGQYDACLSCDYTQFDSTIDNAAIQEQWRFLCRLIGLTCEYRTRKYKLKYAADYLFICEGRRDSGEALTALGNVIIVLGTLMSDQYIYYKFKRGELTFYNDGDDNLVFCKRNDVDLVTKHLIEISEKNHFKLKIEKPIYNEYEIEFCKARLVRTNHGYMMMRDPVKAICKMFYSKLSPLHPDFKDYLRTVLDCYDHVFGDEKLYVKFKKLCYTKFGLGKFSRKYFNEIRGRWYIDLSAPIPHIEYEPQYDHYGELEGILNRIWPKWEDHYQIDRHPFVDYNSDPYEGKGEDADVKSIKFKFDLEQDYYGKHCCRSFKTSQSSNWNNRSAKSFKEIQEKESQREAIETSLAQNAGVSKIYKEIRKVNRQIENEIINEQFINKIQNTF